MHTEAQRAELRLLLLCMAHGLAPIPALELGDLGLNGLRLEGVCLVGSSAPLPGAPILLLVKVPHCDRQPLRMRRQHLVWYAIVGVEENEAVKYGLHVCERRTVLGRVPGSKSGLG